MVRKLVALSALIPAVVLSACGSSDNNVTGVSTNANVRFVNATTTNLDVANAGTVATGNGNLGFGSSTSCMNVNSSNPQLTFNRAGTTTAVTGFTPAFSNGGNYTVLAYTGANGTTQFATLDNTYTATSGQSGVRAFNAASGSGNLVLNGNGTALGSGTGVGFGTSGSFMSVPAGSQAITFNTGTGTTSVLNAGSMTFTAGQNSTIVVAPAATGTGYRAFTVTGC